MKNLIAAATAASLAATAGYAGGVDRSGQGIAPIFEDGNSLEFSFTSVNPSVSGTQLLPNPPFSGTPGSSSGGMANTYGHTGMAFKFDSSDSFSTAFIYEEPFGADVTYPMGTGYFASIGGSSIARLNSDSFTGIGRYKFGGGFSVHGGVRVQKFDANAMIPFVFGYTGATSTDTGYGYLVGAAYERPDIALRVALTYNSSIKHELATNESSLRLPPGGPSTITTAETPESINLDFQTGVAPGTLVFGGVRYVNWSDFVIAPAHYGTLTGGLPLVSFADDTITYTLGVGRQLNENWSIALSAVHEPATGGLKSNLAPTDGRSAIGIGAIYRQDGFKLQAGIQHIWIGDANTNVFGFTGGSFTDNTALAFGLKAGFTF